jgi:hypothetical protein
MKGEERSKFMGGCMGGSAPEKGDKGDKKSAK